MANALAQVIPFRKELESVEDELAATKYAARMQREEEAEQQLMREQEAEQQKQRKAERITTGVLQCVTSVVGGALSTLKWGQVPIGGVLNGVLGSAGVGVTLRYPERTVARVAGQSIQTLLHNQIAITTREIIKGMP
jgi:hypothetical protein